MKEMNIEQKAVDYDEAFRIAQELYNSPNSSNIGKWYVCTIFPKLKESDDERIRKGIIKYLEQSQFGEEHYCVDDDVVRDYIAWLEKQGGQKSVIEIKSPEESLRISSKEYNNIVDICLYGESKPVDKVEPKFKVGDYVVGKYISGYISEVRDDCYLLDYQGFPIDKQDNYHLWTIQDAKAGDILFCKGNIKDSNGIKYERICLFNNLDNAFFTLTKTSNYVEEYEIDVNIDYPDNTVPATKEQKEILFMAMADAGYTFDFEKKELKKIEQKSAWSEDDERLIEEAAECLRKYASKVHLVGSKVKVIVIKED